MRVINTVADVFSDVFDRSLDAEVIRLVEEFDNARKLRWLLDEEHVAQIRDWLESEGY